MEGKNQGLDTNFLAREQKMNSSTRGGVGCCIDKVGFDGVILVVAKKFMSADTLRGAP